MVDSANNHSFENWGQGFQLPFEEEWIRQWQSLLQHQDRTAEVAVVFHWGESKAEV